MLVSGKNVAVEVLKNNKKIRKVYLSNNFTDENIKSLIEKRKLDVSIKNKYELDELANENHQGIIIDIDDYEYSSLEDLMRENGFLVMLDHLEDPHNLGAIIRTCEAAGVDGIIIPKDRGVKVNNTVMKTSAGALENVKICMVTNLTNTINELKENDYWIYGSALEDSDDYNLLDYKGSICLIVGNEGMGISQLVKKNCDYIIKIPMIGKINSLNASVAAGIIIYEAVKQRHK